MAQAKIIGTGYFVPEKIVTNFDLEKLMDTSDEWIRQRSGIEQRRFVSKGEGPADLALEASKMAIKNAGINANDIDCIIACTLSPDVFFPGTSVLLQEKLGLSTIAAMDVRCQCSGFVYGLSVANAFIVSGQYKNILLVGAEVQSVALDKTTRGRDTAVLFGDGAGAVVLTANNDPKAKPIITKLHAQGEHAQKLWTCKPGSADGEWMRSEPYHPDHFAFMEGKFVFKHAVTRLPEVTLETLCAANLQMDEVDHFLFHQANLRINEFVAQSLKIANSKVHNNIQRYGNCSAASIPILLAECIAENKIKYGDTVCMAAFGSGFTWAGAVLTL